MDYLSTEYDFLMNGDVFGRIMRYSMIMNWTWAIRPVEGESSYYLSAISCKDSSGFCESGELS